MTGQPLLGGIGAVALRARLLAGDLSVADVADAFLAAVGEDSWGAWAHLDPDGLGHQAAALDAIAPADRIRLPLYGVPVGIKDNLDTADLPTEYGSPIYAGHRPAADAATVAQLRVAGALIAGKTTCAEFAWMTPPNTRNPLDPCRTPGGSSTGSAVAVAAGTVPLALGTQTAGSINRPASYCGVLGLKPSFGRFARRGLKLMSATLDTVGLLGREPGDLALAASVLGDAVPVPAAARRLSAPRLAFARTDQWAQVEPETKRAIVAWLSAARQVGQAIPELDLPGYAPLAAAQQTIQRFESARALAPVLAAHPELLSDALRDALRDGATLTPEAHAAALRLTADRGPALLDALHGFDAVITPSATGVPPLGLAFTGDPLFSRVWTLLGAPSLSVPFARTAAGLPVPLQLVGPPGTDDVVLDAAAWLLRELR